MRAEGACRNGLRQLSSSPHRLGFESFVGGSGTLQISSPLVES